MTNSLDHTNNYVKKGIPKSIDSGYAANIVRNELRMKESLTAEPLHGGKDPEAQLFLVTSAHHKFVCRFIKNPIDAARESICMKIASDAGYGPRVYVNNPNEGYIVMAYIQQFPIEKNQFSSCQPHRALGEALSKMHHGPSFTEADRLHDKGNFLKHIRDENQQLKHRPGFEAIALRIEEMISTIEQGLSYCRKSAPCHNDLHPLNLLYSGTSFTIIDYGIATQDDPYFDLATAITFNCLNTNQENTLLDVYFKRPRTPQEKAKLYVMKQAVLVCYAIRFFLERPDQKNLQATNKTSAEIMKDFWVGDRQAAMSKYGHSFLHEAIANFDSKEFQDAIKLISKNP